MTQGAGCRTSRPRVLSQLPRFMSLPRHGMLRWVGGNRREGVDCVFACPPIASSMASWHPGHRDSSTRGKGGEPERSNLGSPVGLACSHVRLRPSLIATPAAVRPTDARGQSVRKSSYLDALFICWPMVRIPTSGGTVQAPKLPSGPHGVPARGFCLTVHRKRSQTLYALQRLRLRSPARRE